MAFVADPETVDGEGSSQFVLIIIGFLLHEERVVSRRQVAGGQATNMAATLEIDAVIDPADTRTWLVQGLDNAKACANSNSRTVARAPRMVDTW